MRALRSRTADVLLAVALIAGLAYAGLIHVGGYRAEAVLSGSMQPTLGVGTLVLVRPVASSQVRPGEIITFSSPEDHGMLITHRVVAVERTRGGARVLRTKGDANRVRDPWTIPARGRVGRVVAHVPYAGYGVVWLGSGIARKLLLLLTAITIGFVLLRRIWGSEPVRAEGVSA